MAIESTIRSQVRTVLRTRWDKRKGQVVPETDDVKLSGGAVELDAVYLYSDLAESTTLAHSWKQEAAGKVIRCFLDAASRVIRAEGGEIRSFDGDRVMAIFIGGSKCTTAARCALKINYAVKEIVHEELQDYYSDYPGSFSIAHCTGVAMGTTLLVRGGVRNNNDLVSIGKAPNIAAKLSALRTGHGSYITDDVYSLLNKSVKYGGEDDRPMWSKHTQAIAGRSTTLYRSTWWWRP